MTEGLYLNSVAVRQGSFNLEADLSIARGGVTAVMGPSGHGKSTLLGSIAGFVPLQEGWITWDGQDLSDLSPGQRPLSILFQDNNLFPHLTVAQNIGLGRDPRLKLSAADLSEIDGVLEQLGLAGMALRKPAELSGGQQSRVALGRVLLAEKPLVLLDEPFAALGPGLKQEMLQLAVDVLGKAGRTLIMVTHDPADAEQIASNVIVVANGRAEPPIAVTEALEPTAGPLRGYLTRR